MSGKVAVAVIHGIGSQAMSRPPSSDRLTFSGDLHKRIRKTLGRKHFDKQIVWREIFWSDVLSPRQIRYLEAISVKVNYHSLREFILCNIADAASYKKAADSEGSEGSAGNAYRLIHQRVRSTLAELRADTDDDTPLVVLAHSFGGQIMSNYIWDLQVGHETAPTAFERMETLCGLVTFGSNIPLFLFAYEPENIHPISFPGTKLPNQMRVMPWWFNYYDKDDVIAFPLREIGPKYTEMVDGGEIREIPINVGSLFSSWNPSSHTAYWRDRNFYKPTAEFLEELLARR